MGPRPFSRVFETRARGCAVLGFRLGLPLNYDREGSVAQVGARSKPSPWRTGPGGIDARLRADDGAYQFSRNKVGSIAVQARQLMKRQAPPVHLHRKRGQKENSMSIEVTIDIVVTRHRPLVELLLERGFITAETPVLEHARAEDVRGKHVLGVLPHWLSSLAASVTEVPMRLTQADREAMTRGDLGVERLREVADSPVTYCVEQMSQMPCGGRVVAALATAIKHACGPNGYAVKFLTNDHAAIIEVEDVDGWWRAQVDLYKGAVRISADHDPRVGPHSGKRPANRNADLGPWLDPMTGEPWQMYRVGEDGRRVPCMGYPSEEVEAKLQSERELMLGLVRGAEMIEQRDGGSIWDDQVRNALETARQRGSGAGRGGS